MFIHALFFPTSIQNGFVGLIKMKTLTSNMYELTKPRGSFLYRLKIKYRAVYLMFLYRDF